VSATVNGPVVRRNSRGTVEWLVAGFDPPLLHAPSSRVAHKTAGTPLRPHPFDPIEHFLTVAEAASVPHTTFPVAVWFAPNRKKRDPTTIRGGVRDGR
jgi:hypothetical protein